MSESVIICKQIYAGLKTSYTSWQVHLYSCGCDDHTHYCYCL